MRAVRADAESSVRAGESLRRNKARPAANERRGRGATKGEPPFEAAA